MIDLQNGGVKITEGLWICSGYTFKEFKESRFYKNQDGIRVILLDEEFVLDHSKYDWGEIVSNFDPKGCSSSINIIYF